MQQRPLLLLAFLLPVVLGASDAPPSPAAAASNPASGDAAAAPVAATNASQPPDAANATAPNANATAPSNSTSLLTNLRGRLANTTLPKVSLRPVRKKLANLTGLHGFVSNKNNGSAANRIKTIFASSVVENATVNTTNATLPPLAPPCATVACVTWNLAATSPSSKDAKFLERLRRHDLVCICVQELEDLKPRRQPGHRAEAWTQLLAEKFPAKTHSIVADQSAGPVRLTILQKRKSKLIKVEACATGDVACGIGNVLRNKGCAAAFLDLRVRYDKTSGSAKLLVISAHLAAHAHKANDRDADFHRICRELLPQMPSEWGAHDLLDCLDCCLFAGDLNYRLDLPRAEAERGALAGDYAALLDYDQLKRRKASGTAFADFFEGPINFAPTFKFDQRSATYDSSKKMRVPSWTDRVLYIPRSSRKKSPELTLASYDSVDTRSSDHRPVVATFALRPRVSTPAPLVARKRVV